MSSKPTLDKVPDADEDLDELDDVLDEFSPKAPPPTAAPHATSSYVSPAPGRPRTNTRVDAKPSSTPGRGPPLDPQAEVDEDELSSEFAKELAKGMESLMKEITADAPKAGGDKDGLGDDEASKALKAAWEAMLIEGMNGKGGDELLPGLGELLGDKPPGAASTSGAPSSSTGQAVPENFQGRLKQAMDKMKESEDSLRGASGTVPGPGEPGGDTIENLLKSLNELGLGEGAESDNELAGFLESMMSQLMSKEILHEPLKELADNFPPYIANPPKPLSAEDKERYEKQLVCVKKIVGVFDQPTYSDTDPQCNKQIVDLMSEMQSYGSPPAELMGDLPPGFADGGLPDPNNPENCIIA
ncbi:peroxin19 Pex19p [Coprinopsis sp. MPI-PUGE-AT-0042]|nr:peroxin19 Pex19p [Coprinopsis sp. MPI-PUGE-AT-0042]